MPYICSTYKCSVNAPDHTSERDRCPMCGKNHFDGGKAETPAPSPPSASSKAETPAPKKIEEKRPEKKKSLFSKKK